MVDTTLKIGILGDNSWVKQLVSILQQDFPSISVTSITPSVTNNLINTLNEFHLVFSIFRFEPQPLTLLNQVKATVILYNEGGITNFYYPTPIPHHIINKKQTFDISWIKFKIDNPELVSNHKVSIDTQKETGDSLTYKINHYISASIRKLCHSYLTNQMILGEKQLPHITVKRSPAITGILSWQENASRLKLMNEALTFNKNETIYPKTKCVINNKLYIVNQLEVTNSISNRKPGTLVDVNSQGLEITTNDKNVIIKQLTTILGMPLDPTNVTEENNLLINNTLPCLQEDNYKLITSLLSYKQSLYALKNDLQLPITQNPFYHDHKVTNDLPSEAHITLDKKKEIKLINQFSNKVKFSDIIITSILAYISRLTESTETIVIGTSVLSQHKPPIVNDFFLSTLPLAVEVNKSQDLFTITDLVRKKIEALSKTHIPKDIITNLTSSIDEAKAWIENSTPIEIILTKNNTINKNILRANLTFLINEEAPSIYIYFKTSLLTSSDCQIIVDNIANHLKKLLDTISNNINIRIQDLPILSELDHKKTLVEWNQTDNPFPTELCAHQLFEKQVKKNPNKIAIIHGHKKITFQELNEKANQLAHHLISQQLPVESSIAILFNRSIELIIAILGITKAGYCYVPLNEKFPIQRINFILKHSNARLAITNQEHTDKLQNNDSFVPILNLSQLPDYGTENPIPTATSNNLIYIIYTSGTTGEPKGVAVPHSAVVNLCHWYPSILDKSMPILAGMTAGVSFDVSAGEIWQNLTNGNTLIICPNDVLLDNSKFTLWIKEQQINTLFLSTPLLENFIKLTEDQDFSELTVFTAGEKLLSYKPSWLKKLYNQYGPTEATIFVTYKDVNHINQSLPAPSIGRPLDNVKFFILDDAFRPVAIGVIGCLYIAGDCLARSYFNNPGLTKEKFTHLNINGEIVRCYNTGDFVRYLPNGELDYQQRRDSQIKINGYRIELAEIEANILKFPDVTQCCVVVKETDFKYLAAYITTSLLKQEFAVDKLRLFLADLLPSYMIPGVIVILDQLPMTPNFKVDRKILAEKEHSIEPITIITPAKTSTEKELITLFSQTFNTPASKLGRETNFYYLGGNSIVAMQLSARINSLFNININMATILQKPTILSLANLIDHQKEKQIPNLSSIEIVKPTPISLAQRKLFILWKIEPSNPYYNMSSAYRLKGKFSRKKINDSFNKLISRHEILRTNFHEDKNNNIWQKVSLESEFNFSIEHQHVPLHAIEKAYEEFICKPFHLENDLLIRAKLFYFNETEALLIINIHHIITDGWSTDIINKELSDLYNDIPLRPVSFQYIQYTLWQYKLLNAQIEKKQLGFWKNYLHNLPTLAFSLVHQQNQRPKHEGQCLYFSVNQATSERLKTLAQTKETTLFNIILSSFSLLIFQYTNQNDFAIGTPTAGRPIIELENMLGFFANTLVFRAIIDENQSFNDLLEKNKESLLDIFSNQDIPFDELIEKLKIKRNLTENPLFNIMLGVEPLTQKKPTFSQISVTEEKLNFNYTLFDLAMFIEEDEAGLLQGKLTFSTNHFNSQHISQLTNRFLLLLDEITKKSTKPIKKLAITTDLERQLFENLCLAPNINQLKLPSILELFKRQVIETPEKIAVINESEKLSYYQLDKLSDSIADNIIASKETHHSFYVAILINKRIELPAIFLATMKANYTYIPIDPKLPKERINEILLDANPAVIVYEDQTLRKLEALTLNCVRFNISQLDLTEKNNHHTFTPTNPVYLLYTSGSTGKPKGTLISQIGLSNCMLHFKKQLNFLQKDCFLGLTSISFDIFQLELLLPLISGATLFLAGQDYNQNPEKIHNLINDYPITHIQATPTFWEMFVDYINIRLEHINILVGGEALTTTLAKQLVTKANRVINCYGPTETTIWSTTFELNEEVLQNNIPIGKPISNTSIRIVNTELQQVPLSAKGEILIGGAGLAIDYLNKPKISEERFITLDGQRFYRTGDIGYIDFNGYLYYLGRNDSQIKISGHRVEISDIEENLKTIQPVKNAVIVYKDNSHKSANLTCYYDIKQTALMNFKHQFKKLYQQWSDHWKAIWNAAYDAPEGEQSIYSGWESSIKEGNYNDKEMEQWAINITNQILLFNPRNVLEIGCGTGMILQKIVGSINHYIGIDSSNLVINQLKENFSNLIDENKVQLTCLEASDIETILNKDIDFVIINSVAQYFPSTEYLVSLLKTVLQQSPNASIFIGDLINFEIADLKYFIEACNKAKLYDKDNIIQYVFQKLQAEEELFISPAFFYQDTIKELKIHAQVFLQNQTQPTEMSLFRYNVFLNNHQSTKTDWHTVVFAELTEARVNQIIQAQYDAIKIINIPNERLTVLSNAKDKGEHFNLESLKETTSLFISDLLHMAHNYKYNLLITPDKNNFSSFTVHLFKEQEKANEVYYKLEKESQLDNTPLIHLLKEEITNYVRKDAEKKLPSYMLPSQYLLLQRMPTLISGKIDRKFLKNYIPERKKSTAHLTGLAGEIQKVWITILNHSDFDTNEAFTSAGGSSLGIILMTKRFNEQFKCNLTVTDLFKNQTIDQQVKLLSEQQGITNNVTSHLIELLHINSKHTPIIFIHPITGILQCYKSLLPYLTHDRSYFAFSDPDILTKTSRFNSLEEIASFYLQELRKHFPHDTSFIFSGASFGGNIAVEMAYQWQKNTGETLPVLLFDSWALPQAITKSSEQLNRLRKSFNKTLKEQYQNVDDSLYQKMQENKHQWLEFQLQRAELLYQYQLPTKLDIPVYLFKATDYRLLPDISDDNNFWLQHCEQISTVKVPGAHTTIFSANNVQTLAKEINKVLEKLG